MKKKLLVHVGTFGKPQGLKGEIKINIFTSSFESFKLLKNFFIQDKKTTFTFKELKQVGKKIIGSIDECNNRDDAILFKGKKILALRTNFPRTKDDEYYVVDLIGCKVLNKQNHFVGTVEDIKNFGAGDLLDIHHDGKKNFYIPIDDANFS
ncbi:ribosome maturation factor RimM [Alphaproteobacteria bacterium]|nr:ribosome maturation factor RimM [Alphaproteobacteria bacterium]